MSERIQIGWMVDADIAEAVYGDGDDWPAIEPMGDIKEGDTVELNGRYLLPYRAIFADDFNPDWDTDYDQGAGR